MGRDLIRVGIIGQGRSGRNIHGMQLSRMKDKYRIVAVADLLDERRSRAENEYGCETYSDYREMMKRQDIDVIVNSTPSNLHVPVSLELLNSGFNVICEKPLARKAEEVDLLIETGKRTGKIFTIFQDYRNKNDFIQVKKIVDSGVLGRIVQVSMQDSRFARRWDWQSLQEYNGGSLFNHGSHLLDQALQLLGTDPEVMPEITCKLDRVNSFGDAEDFAKLILFMPDGPVIDIEVSTCNAYSAFRYNIQGTCGSLAGTSLQLHWKYFLPDEAPKQQLTVASIVNEAGLPAYCRETLKWYEETWTAEKGEYDEAPEGFYNDFYETFCKGTPLVVTPLQVRQQIAIFEECHRQNPLSRI